MFSAPSTLTVSSFLQRVSALALLSASALASAQSFDAVRLFTPPQGDGSGSVGAAVIAGRKYLGSDEDRTMFLPSVSYRWANGWFAGTGNGIGYLFKSPEHLQYGLRLTADFGRKAKRSALLAGMDDIDASPEAGAFANLFLSREVFFTSSLRYGSGGDHDGLLFDAGANYAKLVSPQWRLSVGVSATAANRGYMQSYFGVPAAQATAARPAHEAGSGLRDVRASASVTWFITPTWDAMVAVTAMSLQGDAKNSPLVRDRHPVTGVFSLTHDF